MSSTILAMSDPACRESPVPSTENCSVQNPEKDCDEFAWFAKVSARYADMTAIVYGSEKFTYRKVWQRVDALAEIIASSGTSGVIAIYLPNDIDYPVSILACLAAGRTCIALDRNYPLARNETILRAAAPAAIIALSNDRDDVRRLAPAADLLFIDTLHEQGDAGSGERGWPNALKSDDPAIVVYTSGSTGVPKGIILTLRMIMHRARQLKETLRLNPDDVLLSLGSPCTIGGLQQIFEASLAGATLVKFDLQRQGVGGLLETLAKRKVTVLFATPALLRNLVELPGATSALSGLRCVHPSGDVLFDQDFRVLRKNLKPDCAILVVYGATETIAVAQWFVDPEDAGDGSRVAVGYQLPGFDFTVLDQHGRPLPAGEPGELWIRSCYISPGAWEANAVTRISDDISIGIDRNEKMPSEQLFRTGDLVRIRPDGLMIVLGRLDRQVKIRGMRVEPYEIESCMRTDPNVLDAAVVMLQSDRDPSLVAFARVARRTASSDADIIAKLGMRLPSFMIPSRVILLDEMPMLPGQKIDVVRLRELAEEQEYRKERAGETKEFSSPFTCDALTRAWTSVLDGKSLVADQRFDEAGGDSLGFLRMIFELEASLGRKLPFNELDMSMRPSNIEYLIKSGAKERGSAARTFFMCPGVGGDEPLLMSFRAACGSGNRFVALRYPDWRDAFLPDWGLPGVAAQLARQIVAAQPQGPIYLAGYSFGADVAYLLVSRLEALGRQVGALFVFDQTAPTVHVDFEPRNPHSFVVRIGRRFSLSEIYEKAAFKTAYAFLCTKRIRAVRFVRSTLHMLVSSRLEFVFHRAFSQTEHMMKMIEWRKAFQCPDHKSQIPLVLFRAEDRDAVSTDDLGWNMLFEHVTVVNVEGDHRTIFQGKGLDQIVDYFASHISAIPSFFHTSPNV